MKIRSFLTLSLILGGAIAFAQEIKFETSELSSSVALHPQIFDVQKDGKNDIVVVDKYIDARGNDGENIKTILWISGSDKKKYTDFQDQLPFVRYDRGRYRQGWFYRPDRKV